MVLVFLFMGRFLCFDAGALCGADPLSRLILHAKQPLPPGSSCMRQDSLSPGGQDGLRSNIMRFALICDVESSIQLADEVVVKLGRSEERRVGKECRSRW